MPTLEEEVASLTSATTDLLEAVNVKKATLDAQVDEATAQAVVATDQAAAATIKAAEADASATLATQRASEAATARDEAVAVVTGGAASLAPAAGKIPIAGADGLIHPGWLPASEMDYVGVAYNHVTKTFERLGAAKGWPVGAFPGVQISPIFSRLRRVTLKDDGTVFKPISWLDFTKYDDGASVPLDGTDGQIMVEYLPAYVRTEIVGDWYQLKISHLPLSGFTLYPLFVGKEAAYRGAYEASIYNFGGTDKLCSIAKSPADGVSAVYPVTTRAGAWGHASLTTAATDTLAAARGAGWRQSHLLSAMWERILQIVGFGTYNILGAVGNGRVSLSGGSWINDSYIGPLGLGDAVSGLFSANSTSGAPGFLVAYSQCLGIENSWGHVWERVASLISDWQVFHSNPPYNYTTTAGWTRLIDAAGAGITLPNTNGYAGKPHSGLGMVLPADVSGSSTTGMYDYFYQSAGLRVLLVGGSSDDGAAPAGPFYWYAYAAATSSNAIVGGRLCFERNAPA